MPLNEAAPPPAARVPSARLKWKWLLTLAVLAALAGMAWHFRLHHQVRALLQQGLEWVRQLGVWAPVMFILLYVVSCVALVPGAVLTLGGGALFGAVWGTLYVWIGATLGATAAFLSGRYAARDWVTRKIGHHPLFVAIERAVESEGFKIVFLTRLAPVFPFFLMNYGYALTRVRLRHYFLATCLGILPGSALFTYIGSLAHAPAGESDSLAWLKRGFIVVTSIVAVALIARVARRALAKKLGA